MPEPTPASFARTVRRSVLKETGTVEEFFLVRLSNDYILRVICDLARLFDGDIVLGIVFIAVNQANTSHLLLAKIPSAFQGDGVVPQALRRPASALAVAASLGLPRETVRRHIGKLVERGDCVRVAGRKVLVSEAAIRRPELMAAVESNRRNLQKLIGDVRRAKLLREQEPAEG